MGEGWDSDSDVQVLSSSDEERDESPVDRSAKRPRVGDTSWEVMDMEEKDESARCIQLRKKVAMLETRCAQLELFLSAEKEKNASSRATGRGQKANGSAVKAPALEEQSLVSIQLEQQLRETQERLKRAEESAVAKEDAYRALEEQHEQERSGWRSELLKLRTEYTELADTLQAHKVSAKAGSTPGDAPETYNAGGDADLLRSQVVRLESEMAELKDECEAAKQCKRQWLQWQQRADEFRVQKIECERLRAEASKSIVLEEQLRDAKSRLKDMEQQMHALNEEQSEHISSLRELKAWKTQFPGALPEQIATQLKALVAEEQTLRQSKDAALASATAGEELSSGLSGQVSRLRDEAKQQQAQIRSQQDELGLYKARAEAFKNECNSIRKLVQSYETALSSRSKGEEGESGVLSAKVQQLQEELAIKDALVQKLSETATKTSAGEERGEASSVQTSAEAPMLKQRCRQLEIRTEELACELTAALQRATSAEGQSAELKSQVQKLGTELAEVRSISRDSAAPSGVVLKDGDADGDKGTRVWHMKINPTSTALGLGSTAPADAKNATEDEPKDNSAESVDDRLRSVLEERDQLEKRCQRLREVFARTSREFREACYLLTGFKIEMQPEKKRYVLHPMFAESDEDVLVFRNVSPTGNSLDLELLETPFCKRFNREIEAFLMKSNCVPAFLSQITLEMFNATKY